MSPAVSRPALRGMRWLALAACVSFSAGNLFAQTRISDTPSLIQDDFGPGGFDLDGDGTEYCGPTTATMSLAYLANQGFTQLLPENPGFNDYLNLEQVLVGLSGASFTSGVSWSTLATAMEMVARAGGISSFATTDVEAPQTSFFVNAQTGVYTATALNIQWLQRTTPTGNDYVDTGGHFVSVVGANATTNQLVLNNPMPSALFFVADLPQFNPQYADTIAFTGNASGFPLDKNFRQFDPGQPGSSLSNTTTGALGVIDYGYTMSIHPSDLPTAPGWTPATWTLTAATRKFSFDDASLTVVAPLQGSHGILKQGTGSLVLAADNTTTGNHTIEGGSVVLTSSSDRPIGDGGISLKRAALRIEPSGASPSVLTLTLAGGAGSQFVYGPGGVLAVDPGNHAGLMVNIGRSDQPVTTNFSADQYGTLVVQLTGGLQTLGNATQVKVLGTGSLPAANGMLSPGLVAADPTGSATFLTDSVAGLVPAAYISSSSTSINSANATMVFDVVGNQTITSNSTAAVYALRVASGRSVSGSGATLQVGTRSAGSQAGMILNNGAGLAVGQLDFGSGDGFVYSSGTGNLISGGIVADDLVFFGPGAVTWSGNSSLAGMMHVASGSVTLGGGLTHAGQVQLGNSTIVVGAGVALTGNLTSSGGTIVLDGGTVGQIQTDTGSTLSGSGTIAGNATVNGLLAPGAAEMRFEGSLSMDGNSMLAWTLADLVDSTNGTAGVDWTLLTLAPQAGGILDLDGFSFENDFNMLGAAELPNGADPFWEADRSWLVVQSTARLVEDGNTFDPTWGIPTYLNGQFHWNISTDSGQTYPHQMWLYYDAGPIPEPATVFLFFLSGLIIFGAARIKKVPAGLEAGRHSE